MTHHPSSSLSPEKSSPSLSTPFLGRLAITLVACLFLFPDHFFNKPRTGLEPDPSWQLALQMAAAKGLVWGRDIAFTYGPLGYLCPRLPFPSFARAFLLSDLFVITQLITVSWQLSGLLQGWFSYFAALGLIALFGWTPFYIELPLLLFAFNLFALGKFLEKGSLLWFVLAALDATLCLFIKVNVGLFGILQCLAVGLLFAVTQPRKVSDLISLFLALAVPLLVMTAMLPVAPLSYLKTSWQLASGFVDSMGVTFPTRQPFLILAACILIGWSIALLQNMRTWLSAPFLLLLVALSSLNIFLVFKQGFVRADGHELSFFTFAPLTMLITAFFAPTPFRGSLLRASLLAIACGLPIWHDHITMRVFTGQLRGLKEYPAEARELLTLKAKNEEYPLVTPPQQRLSETTLKLIGTSGVDVLPWDASIAFYNKLTYRPRPVIQSYSAYTPFLIAKNEEFYRSSEAPQFLFIAGYCIDGRLCQQEDPGAQRAILERYQPVGEDAGFLLLEKRDSPRATRSGDITQDTTGATGKLNTWIDIPEQEGITYLRANIPYSFAGKLRHLLYKPADIRILLRLESGEVRDFRGIRGALEFGVPISRLIETTDDLRNLYQGHWQNLRRVSSFQIRTNSSFGLADSYTYNFWRYFVDFSG